MLDNIALITGYLVLIFFAALIISLLFKFLLYKETIQSTRISENKVFINDKLIYEFDKTITNVTTVNGNIYANGKLVYKYKRKFRWQN